MAYNQLPPQAYTKDDVAKAYVWLQAQPEYVRNMATSKETLVTLYLQARRNGNTSVENLAPVSSRDFKSQLQSLASELEQFGGGHEQERYPTTGMAVPFAAPESRVHSSPPISPLSQQFAPPKPESTQVHIHQTFQQNMQEAPKPPSQPQPSYHAPLPPLAAEPQDDIVNFVLDARSEHILSTLKEQLNMESENDIIRMLMVLGFEKIKEIFPNRK